MSLNTVFDYQQSIAMKAAFERAWGSLAFAYEPGTNHGEQMKEMLANVILEVASGGNCEPQLLCDLALRRLPPVVSYHARERYGSDHPLSTARERKAVSPSRRAH